MENATKALLIAAAVLVAIVLIALGVNLLNSSGDASEQANQVADQINSTISGKIEDIESSLGGL